MKPGSLVRHDDRPELVGIVEDAHDAYLSPRGWLLVHWEVPPYSHIASKSSWVHRNLLSEIS